MVRPPLAGLAPAGANPKEHREDFLGVTILFIGLIFFAAHGFSLLFEKKAVPDVLLLMLIGILAGPVFHIAKPEDFGKWGDIVSSITLVAILFEGGMALEIKSIRETARGALPLFLFTFAATGILAFALAFLAFKLDLLASLAFGGAVASISPAVALPMAKGFGLSKRGMDILTVDTALTDVLSIILVFSFVLAYKSGDFNAGHLIGSTLSALTFAAIIGFAASFLWLRLLEFVRKFPNTMLSTFAFLFMVYGFTEFLGFSGAIASLFFGLGLVNKPFGLIERLGIGISQPETDLTLGEKSLFGEVIFVLRTFFFLYLGISLRFDSWEGLLAGAGLSAIIVLARTWFSRWIFAGPDEEKDREIIGAMIPKGLATAVLAALPLGAGMAGGAMVRDLSYQVIFSSIVLTSLIAFVLKYRRGHSKASTEGGATAGGHEAAL